MTKGWSDKELNTQFHKDYKSYKVKFSQRDNIYLVDLKYNITYQNIWGEPRSDQLLYHYMAKMTKKLPFNLHG